jgi:signal peptidase
MNSLNGNIKYFVHSGNSMYPALCDGDLLMTVPCSERIPFTGDIIVFKCPGEDTLTVHRIMRVTDQGILTRGDNNAGNDPWMLRPDVVKGTVVDAWREGKKIRIISGRKGLLSAALKRASRPVRYRLNSFFYPLYHYLERRGIVRGIVLGRLKPKIVIFKGDRGFIRRLVLGKHVVGEFDERRGQWKIRRPFRLFFRQSTFGNNK